MDRNSMKQPVCCRRLSEILIENFLLFTFMIPALTVVLVCSGCRENEFDRKAASGFNERFLEELTLELEKIGNPWHAGVTMPVRRLMEGIPFERFLGAELSSGEISLLQSYAREKDEDNDAGSESVPAKFSWCEKDGASWTGEVKNQGLFPVSVAFAVTGMLESRLRIKKMSPGERLDFSELHLFSRAGGDFAGGISMKRVLDSLVIEGTVLEEYCPYSNAPAHYNTQCELAEKIKIKSYNFFSGREAMKKALLEGPFMAMMAVYQDFFYYERGVYEHRLGLPVGYVAVLVVGWDDGDGRRGAWRVKLPWGEQWGERGFARIGYGQCGMEELPSYSVVLPFLPGVDLEPPSDIRVAYLSEDNVILKWTPVAGAEGYLVSCSSGLSFRVEKNEVELRDLPADREYTVQISAVNYFSRSKPSLFTFRTPADEWQEEQVMWRVMYGDSWNEVSGIIKKPGASSVKIVFGQVKLEEGYDFLRVSTGDVLTGYYENYTTGKVDTDTVLLILSSDASNHYSFLIERILWKGESESPARKEGLLFRENLHIVSLELSNVPERISAGKILNLEIISVAARFSDGSLKQVIPEWSVEGAGTVNGNIFIAPSHSCSTMLVATVRDGETSARASFVLTVFEVSPVALELSPCELTLPAYSTFDLLNVTVNTRYSDGSKINKWAETSFRHIYGPGLLTGRIFKVDGPGTTSILRATFIEGSATITADLVIHSE